MGRDAIQVNLLTRRPKISLNRGPVTCSFRRVTRTDCSDFDIAEALIGEPVDLAHKTDTGDSNSIHQTPFVIHDGRSH